MAESPKTPASRPSKLSISSSREEPYGQELILDLHDCDATRFTRIELAKYLAELCEIIDMERCELYYWDDVGVPEEDRQKHPKTKGTSVVQFILTSTIVVHTLDLLGSVYVNIFSCKTFDVMKAQEFTVEWFKSSKWVTHLVTRH